MEPHIEYIVKVVFTTDSASYHGSSGAAELMYVYGEKLKVIFRNVHVGVVSWNGTEIFQVLA